MKKTLLIVMGVVLFCGFAFAEVGRYQLVIGMYDFFDGGEKKTGTKVFKIDTVTGQAWYYVPEMRFTGKQSGKITLEVWMQIENDDLIEIRDGMIKSGAIKD